MNEYFNKLLKSRNEQNRNSAFYHYDSHTRKNSTKATTIKNKSITRRIEATAIIEKRISMLLLKNKKSNNKDKIIKSKSKPNNHDSVFISTVSPQPSRVCNNSFETPIIEIKNKALIQFKQLNTLTKSSNLKNSIDSLPLNNLPSTEHPLIKIKQYNPSESQSSYSYSPFLTAKNYKSSRSPSPIVIQKANKLIMNPNILQKKKALKSLSIDTNKKETFKYFNSSNHQSFINKTNSNKNIKPSSFRSNRPKNDVIVVTKLTKRSSVPIFRNSSTNKITDKSPQKYNISVILKKRKITNLYKAPKTLSHNISQPDDQPNLSKENFSRRNSKSTNKTSRSILCTSSTIMIQKKISNIAHFTKTGFAGFGVYKTNQDNYFISELPENSIHYFGICDGHGEKGELVSSYIKDTLRSLVLNEIKEKAISMTLSNSTAINKIIENNIIITNSKLSNCSQIDSNFSGSTCNSILINNEMIVCANVGDSRSILGKVNNQGVWSYETLSRDHKPSEADEAKRIIRFGGRVEPYKEVNGSFVGPKRVWHMTKQMPGLAMTRSFGDQIASSVGVICEPEIKCVPLKEEDKFIIMGSDGLWEYMSNKECIKIVLKYYNQKDINTAINQLYKETHKKWREVSIIK